MANSHLRELVGPEWLVRKASDYMTETSREERKYLWEIPCRRGKGRFKSHIYLHSKAGGKLLAFTGTGTRLRRQLLELGCTPHQTGDKEFAVLFPVSLLPVVAAHVKARRPRKKAVDVVKST